MFYFVRVIYGFLFYIIYAFLLKEIQDLRFDFIKGRVIGYGL